MLNSNPIAFFTFGPGYNGHGLGPVAERKSKFKGKMDNRAFYHAKGRVLPHARESRHFVGSENGREFDKVGDEVNDKVPNFWSWHRIWLELVPKA